MFEKLIRFLGTLFTSTCRHFIWVSMINLLEKKPTNEQIRCKNRQISNLNFAFGEDTLLLLSTAYIYHHVTFTRYLLLQKKTTGHFQKLLHLTDISLT